MLKISNLVRTMIEEEKWKGRRLHEGFVDWNLDSE